MKYPIMVIMRASFGGCIWQAYKVENEEEETILTRNAQNNSFVVETEKSDYTDETTPNWRDTPEWKECLKINRA